MRADIFLVENGYAKSRNEAQAAIRAGTVLADGRKIEKPSQLLKANMNIEYVKPHPYVSRGGLKLAAALEKFALSAEHRICLDIGASTGSFTEVLLNGGASKVYAVDVGHGQLNPKLARDPRIVRRDGVNARDLTRTHVPDAPDAITIDVSFIGLKLALPRALEMAAPGAWLVALVKPQFEVGRFAIGKGGVVRDAAAQKSALEDISSFIAASGWTVLGHMDSPITGGEGNREFLIAAQKP